MSQNTLKDWRIRKGLTQQQLAQRLNVHVQYLSKIERGARRPGMQLALALRDLSEGELSLDGLIPEERAA